MPDTEGGGKSIRMMNWLAYLSSHYKLVYCVYFYSGKIVPRAMDNLPENILFIPIGLISVHPVLSFLRRSVIGMVKPYLYSLYWYEKIKKEDLKTLYSLCKKTDAVLIFRLYLFPVLMQLKNDIKVSTRIAIDMDDAETDTYDQVIHSEWKKRLYKKWLVSSMGRYYMHWYEQHIPQSVNIMYYSNPLDVEKYKSRYSEQEILHFPNKVPSIEWKESNLARMEDTILFVGSLNYHPNEDAIYFLIKEIWPRILYKKKNAKLIIAGSKPGKDIKDLIHHTGSVSLVENPEVIKEVFDKASLLIVPLRLAGGTRIKVLQAFAYGVPVVSTSIGVAGLDVRHNETGMIGDDAAVLADYCIHLLNDPPGMRTLAKNAHDFYTKYHSFHI